MPWNLGVWWLLHHALTITSLVGEGEGLLQLWGGTWGLNSWPAQCPLCTEIPPPTPSYMHSLEILSHPLTNSADQDNKNPPKFFPFLRGEGSSFPPGTLCGTSSGAAQTSTGAGRRGRATSPLLLAVCPQIRLGRIGNLSPGNQNIFTFPRTQRHLKLCSNNLHKQIYYAIYVMQHWLQWLCSSAYTTIFTSGTHWQPWL